MALNVQPIKTKILSLINYDTLLTALGASHIVSQDNCIRCSCPVHHGDNETAFLISKTTGIWRCYTKGCNENPHGADIIALVQNCRGLSFVDSLKYLCALCGMSDFSLSEFNIENNAINNSNWANKNLEPKNQNISDININPSLVRSFMLQRTSYMAGRGFTEKTLDDFEIGHSFDWMKHKGFYNLPIKEERVTIPIKFKEKYVGIQGRCVKGKGLKNQFPNDYYPRNAKYDNLKDFQKGKILYNFDRASKFAAISGRMLVAEGTTDVMKWHQAGVLGSVGILGRSVTIDQIILLASGPWGITMALDENEAGRSGMQKFFSQAKHLFDINILPLMPQDKDAGSCSSEELLLAYSSPKKMLLI